MLAFLVQIKYLDNINLVKAKKEGDNGLFITLVPKVLQQRLTTLGTFI